MTRVRASVSVAALGALMTLLFGACAAPPAPTGPTDWQADMLASLNSQRAANGAGPLTRCAALDRAAQGHSFDQAAHDKMSHTGSDGSTMRQRIESAGYRGGLGWAENVAAGYPDVASVMNGWMGSSGHRSNILNPSYEHVGFGFARSASGAPYWTQNFGRHGSC